MAGFDPIAVYAAFVATGALFLEVRRWFESGPRLRLSLMNNARLVGAKLDSNVRYLVITVSNVGDRPTTINSMLIADYETLLGRLMGRAKFNAIVPNPSENPSLPGVPFVLEPGHQWQGRLGVGDQPELKKRVDSGWFFVGIGVSHRSKGLYVRSAPVREPEK